MLGLGSSIVKGGAGAKTIVTDNLLLKHNYDAGPVHQVSTGAASFVRSDVDSVSLGFGTALTPKTTGFTTCFWAKTNDLSSAQMALACDNGTDQRMYIGIHLGYWRFGWGNTAWGNGNTPAKTEWTHIALVHTTSTDTTQMYINGAKDTTYTDTGSGAFNDGTFGGDFVIGKHGASGDVTYAWDGYICNTGIWTRTLTQAEIKSIMWKNYANLSSGEKADLVSWYNLDSTIGESTSTGASTRDSTFVLDNHGYSLGSEMVDNFGFEDSSQTDYTTANATYEYATGNNGLAITTTGTGSSPVNQTVTIPMISESGTATVEAAKKYLVSFDIVSKSTTTNAGIIINPATSSGVTIDKTGEATDSTKDHYWYPNVVGSHSSIVTFGSNRTDVNLQLHAGTAVGSVATFDNVSFKEIIGNTGTLS